MSRYDYGHLTGRSPAAPVAAQGPQMAATPRGSAARTNEPVATETNARSLLDLRTSPAAWFVILTLGAAYLARAGGFIGR